jgi:cell wall-associated NlpC family hydrolase
MPTDTALARCVRAHSHTLATIACTVAGAALITSVPSPTAALATNAHVPSVPAPSAVGLAQFESALGVLGASAFGTTLSGDRAAKRAVAKSSPLARAIRSMMMASNRIARRPYVWGGGHGSFQAPGYDCSGSVSYVLHAAGLLEIPLDSTGLETYGRPGPGRHVTIYANAEHALMVIDGRRFDTIALQETGTRWSSTLGDTSGYVVRHPRGL